MRRSQVPVYVVTGFLGAGKTTFLNKLFGSAVFRDRKILALSFEAGEEELCCGPDCGCLSFSKRELEQDKEGILRTVEEALRKCLPDEIWVEWNGMAPFSELQDLLLSPALHRLCRLEKMLHLADAAVLPGLLGRTGGALPGQVAECDFVVLRNVPEKKTRSRVRRMLRSFHPGLRIFDFTGVYDLFPVIYGKDPNPVKIFCFGLFYITAMYLLLSRVIDFSGTPVNTLINVFLGIMLQAVPFLTIGVLISSAIQVFLPASAMERRFPKRALPGMLAAVLFGFCLPVCDCASVPIFRSLVKKGVPLPAAVTFLMATPVINPVVILSTWYAFSGSVRMVAARVGLGILSALLIGLFFAVCPEKPGILSDGYDGAFCSCGCYVAVAEEAGWKSRLGLFLRHSRAEFFQVGKYLMLGAFLSAFFQAAGARGFSAGSGAGFALSLLVMMMMAFLLSLCSSSDAVVARSFGSLFPLGAVMGFLVFGPMMDVKNLLMLSGSFSGRFVAKLLCVTFLVTFLVVLTLARPLLGA